MNLIDYAYSFAQRKHDGQYKKAGGLIESTLYGSAFCHPWS